MRRRSLATFGLGAVAGATACALLTTGLVLVASDTRRDAGRSAADGSAAERSAAAAARTSGVTLPRPAAARAQALPEFGDCEELRRWYVDLALPQVGPWGFGAGPAYRRGPIPLAAASADRATAGVVSTDAVGSSDTGTNVQESGVDEPDTAKTDGRVLVRVVGDHLVVDDVRGDRPRRLSRIELPGRYVDRELLLVGDTVLVLGTRTRWGYRSGTLLDTPGRILPWGSSAGRTHLTEVDISHPGAPVVESHQRVDGSLVAAREYGDGTVRVVVDTGYPVLDFVLPGRGRSRQEARRLNREIVRKATIDDWLPGLRRGDGTGRHPLLDCTDVRHPATPAGFGTLTTLTMTVDTPQALDSPGALSATAITAAGDLVYSSADRLYVATLPSAWWDAVPLRAGSDSSALRRHAPATTVHAFALDGSSTTYVASGTVRGTVRDRWSFDERDGLLRVATALGRDWTPRENALSVLEEDGNRLRVVGSVAGLGRHEQIQSVRWFDDLAVLVTFRQTDPLYTVDLSAPRSPAVLGALKIRGFSAYLHPVGGDLLLGLGQDATGRGVSLGGQAATFDLADLRAVTRTDTYGFGRATDLVDREPRAFTYLPEQRLAFMVVTSWRTGRTELVALHVGATGKLGGAGTWRLHRWAGEQVRTLPLGDGRVAIVDRDVRIVDVG
jgi:hypothetical protein